MRNAVAKAKAKLSTLQNQAKLMYLQIGLCN